MGNIDKGCRIMANGWTVLKRERDRDGDGEKKNALVSSHQLMNAVIGGRYSVWTPGRV